MSGAREAAERLTRRELEVVKAMKEGMMLLRQRYSRNYGLYTNDSRAVRQQVQERVVDSMRRKGILVLVPVHGVATLVLADSLNGARDDA